jgi:hypothetical protein
MTTEIKLYRQKGAPVSVMGGEAFEYERDTAAEAVIAAVMEWRQTLQRICARIRQYEDNPESDDAELGAAEKRVVDALSSFNSSRGANNG